MKSQTLVIVGVAALALLAVDCFWWYQPNETTAPPAPVPIAVAPAPARSQQVAQTPVTLHPIESLEPGPASSAPPDAQTAMTDLFGRKAVLSLFQLDDFARRVTATVDNLGRAQAPSRLWPLNPASGRFTVDRQGSTEVISADNGLRYTPYVLLIETVDLRQVMKFYASFYPQFQHAFEDLGYPGRYFNDRLIEVIDQQLATPTTDTPVKVRLLVVNGPYQPDRPWELYEFEDPALQSLTAGQRLLIRMGPVNERRVKLKLAELGRLAMAGPPAR